MQIDVTTLLVMCDMPLSLFFGLGGLVDLRLMDLRLVDLRFDTQLKLPLPPSSFLTVTLQWLLCGKRYVRLGTRL